MVLVKRQIQVVQNVKHAKPEPSAASKVKPVSRAQKDMHGTEPITTQRSAGSVRWAKQQRLWVVLPVNDGKPLYIISYFSFF